MPWSLLAKFHNFLIEGKVNKARQMLRKKYYQGKTQDARELVKQYFHSKPHLEYFNVVRKLITGCQIRIPATKIDLRITGLQDSKNVGEFAENLSKLRDHLIAANKEFCHKKHLLDSITDIGYGAVEAREKFYHEQLKIHHEKFDKWATLLSQRIDTSIRDFYRQRGDVPISDTATLRTEIRGDVLGDWDHIEWLLDWDELGYEYLSTRRKPAVIEHSARFIDREYSW